MDLQRPASISWRAWVADVRARLIARWQLKALLTLAISIFFCVPYFLIGHFPMLPVRELPLTWLDRAIGFHPYEWVWVYQSVYVPMNVIPWLAGLRDELVRFARGFIILSSISFAIFFIYPVRGPKPPVADATGMYWLLLSYDTPQNSLPSLHAGLLVYALRFGRRIFGAALPPGLAPLCGAWAALILYATLATKEHYLIDIIAGTALGIVVDVWVWRHPGSSDAQQPGVRTRDEGGMLTSSQ